MTGGHDNLLSHLLSSDQEAELATHKHFQIVLVQMQPLSAVVMVKLENSLAQPWNKQQASCFLYDLAHK